MNEIIRRLDLSGDVHGNMGNLKESGKVLSEVCTRIIEYGKAVVRGQWISERNHVHAVRWTNEKVSCNSQRFRCGVRKGGKRGCVGVAVRERR